MKIEQEAYVVPGFLANGIHAGIKEDRKKDLSLIYSTVPATAAAVFTTNVFKAAPVLLDMERIKSGRAQAILTNSGNANAATGPEGYGDARATSAALSKRLNIQDDLVLVASTGVIGHRLPVKKIESGLDKLIKGLRPEGVSDAEEAIMTTDRFPKIAIRKGRIGAREITLCGMAKGAGMIEPHMATMLAYVMTDAHVDGAALDRIFRRAVDQSFNAVSVDGCMSTNDTAIILANGAAGNPVITNRSKSLPVFQEMLVGVLSELSQSMVRDGEGATKMIRIDVQGARTCSDARKIAYAIANSNLFKTACFGQDPNWGRIIAAAGSAGIPLPVDAVDVYFEETAVFKQGRGVARDMKKLRQIMSKETLRLRIQLDMGAKSFCLYTSDLSYDYVKINAHYHT
ncbi:MAG: bifunctional glutamate N-acetyltransferase/amino-acid acetyltransferase ArgJ [Syntrophales bacterium]|nr:bifunctional glutamate N-acetyltransferase/amino-acid acetyltransferase ArgJ [Syntrophales bacterium]